MARQSKPHKPINCKMRADLWDELDSYCSDMGTTKTFVIEKAVSEYLQKHKKQKEILQEHNLD